MALVASTMAAAAADRRAFNAFTKGKHDDLVCPSLEDLAVQLAGKHKGATASGVSWLLKANPQCHKVDSAGVIRRVPRCQFTKKAAVRLQEAIA